MDKQVPIAVEDGKPAITAADFVVKGTRVAIYVDSAAFHKGERLRRDRRIRFRLREAGWRVVEVRAHDLVAPAAVIALIRAAQVDEDAKV